VANGDLSKKITVDARGEILRLKNTINMMVDQLNAFAAEVTRVAREVGTEGKLGGQAYVKGVSGTWKDLTDNVNSMAENLTQQVRNIAEVTTAVANGDLSRKITVEVRGEILELKNTINTMVDRLNAFAAEVTRVAREVGTEGKLGGQAEVKGVSGTWKELTDNVNGMASNLTSQVRGIAKVVTAVAKGDLKRKLVLQAKGEIEVLADTINEMIETLAVFADQVTTVAREVGVEGKLGGQARVPGAAGIWRDLTDNVNQLAANLTTQVRAIAEVATAVTKGDLSRSIAVEAHGEVAQLKDNINEMIRNLQDTTQKNADQDWLKTNLTRFTRLLQGQRNLQEVSRLILSQLAPLVEAQHGLFYVHDGEGAERPLRLLASYAHRERKHVANRFGMGEGLVGQCALEKERILLANVPPDYVLIGSGLGEAAPLNIVVLPVLFEGDVKAVIEMASFHRFTDIQLTFLEQLTESMGIVLNTITATMRTEELLRQSQSMAEELQSQQEELQQTNEELEEKARLLSERKEEVERKNREVEIARQAMQEKAEQLAITSRYKSQFLANMSHELRTPLNSLMILARLLGDNAEGNLTGKQIEFATTIHAAGADLLALINEILDLSKIESGTMSIEVEDVGFGDVKEYVERTFRQVADTKGLEFEVQVEEGLPDSLRTDSKRLQQVLRNLLSNAFKFTDEGGVSLAIRPAKEGWSYGMAALDRAPTVVAFAVTDTGIGIPKDKQRLIFEAFQQADGSTSRRYGGTGLGLSISREIATLLGGEIVVDSEPGRGSTFTLFVPLDGAPAERSPKRGAGLGARRSNAPALPIPETDGDGEATAVDVPYEIPMPEVQDDRDTVMPGDRVVLIAEDDPVFAAILRDSAREQGFKVIVATRGDEALALARQRVPDALTLDLDLPNMSGWQVLDRLKHDPKTRHIPIHIISVEEDARRGLRLGALGHLTKPVTKEGLTEAFGRLTSFVRRPVKNLLIVEDDDGERSTLIELIGNGDVRTTGVSTGKEALEALKTGGYDCMVLDLGLPDMSGFELLDRIQSEFGPNAVPIIVYTGRELTRREEADLRRFAETIIVKDAKSPERLLDETALFLHRVEANLPENKRRMIQSVHQKDATLAGRKVLIVDDDIRNIFAISAVLERQGMEVRYAENGREGIETLRSWPEAEVVLMDVMMPEMDGYETMRAVRSDERFRDLPIIALTAKAMKGDREKCLEAGASDYVTKPVDVDQLQSLLRVWLYR
jgi:CheY-like chemotaxis protein/HAMP domain-containing protein